MLNQFHTAALHARIASGLLCAAWLLTAAISVHAQVPGPDAEMWQQPFERRQPGLRSARHVDAHADRVLVGPTAETHPEGTLYLTSYEILLPSVGYAFTDRMQATLTGITDGDAGFFDLTLKANLLRSRLLRIATHASVDVIVPEEEQDDDDAIDLLLGRAGGTLQVCFELACRSSFSLSLTLVAHDAADTVLPVGISAGFTARASSVLTFLLEYSMLLNASRELPIIDLPFYLLSYGARLTADPRWSLDLALMRSMEGDEDLRVDGVGLFELIGVPLLAFTWRFL